MSDPITVSALVASVNLGRFVSAVDPVGSTVLSGSLLVAIPLALLAGLVSFASPCVLPLVPGYLGYVGGNVGIAKTPTGTSKTRLMAGAALFVLGFTIVFIAFGILFGAAGLLLRPWLDLITRAAGVLVIIMGLVFLGRVTFLQRTFKPEWAAATGWVGAPLLGIVFALGWTPCVGPTLVALYSIVLDQGDPMRGALLAMFYSFGLGLPFLAIAMGLGWATGSVAWLRRHIRTINIVGGLLLIAIGLAMVSGIWSQFMSRLTVVVNGFVPAL